LGLNLTHLDIVDIVVKKIVHETYGGRH